jgi:hypothetical protein
MLVVVLQPACAVSAVVSNALASSAQPSWLLSSLHAVHVGAAAYFKCWQHYVGAATWCHYVCWQHCLCAGSISLCPPRQALAALHHGSGVVPLLSESSTCCPASTCSMHWASLRLSCRLFFCVGYKGGKIYWLAIHSPYYGRGARISLLASGGERATRLGGCQCDLQDVKLWCLLTPAGSCPAGYIKVSTAVITLIIIIPVG